MRKFLVGLAVWLAGFILYFVIVPRATYFDFLVASVSSFVAAAIFAKVCVSKPSKLFNPKRLFIGLAFMLYYLFYIEVKAHLSVISMVFNLKKIKPAVVRIPYDYLSEYSIAAAADFITNTPGTLVIDVDEDNKMYFVHWLRAEVTEPRKAWERILDPFDRWVKSIFEG